MKKLILLFLICTVHSYAQDTSIRYPYAYTDTVADFYFGDTIQDPYRWLENRQDDSTKQWLAAEKKFANKYLEAAKGNYSLNKQLRLNSRNSFGVRHKTGKYYLDLMSDFTGVNLYIQRSETDEPYKAVEPRKYCGPDDRVGLSSYAISQDEHYIAFSLAYNGSDWREIRFRSIYPFNDLPDVLKRVKFSSICWGRDGIFYLRYPKQNNELEDSLSHPAIYYHKLGTQQEEDKLVYQYNGSHIEFDMTPSGQHLVIYGSYTVGGLPEKKVMIINAGDTSYHLDTLISAVGEVKFEAIGEYNGKMLVKTDEDASNFKLMLYDMHATNSSEEFIPAYKQILRQASIIGDKVVCIYMQDLDYSCYAFDSTGHIVHNIDFPTGVSVDGFESDRKDSVTVFYYYSFLHPPVVYRCNVNTFAVEPVDKTIVQFNMKDFMLKKVFYYSKDSESIPMIIAYKKNMKLNGDNPAILYGYGGFGVVNTPFYDRGFMSFIQNGGVLAVPCVRGGGEMGEIWHIKGSLYYKQNAYDDFIAAAEYLFREQYTNKGKLALMGGSNGGLMVAAVVNQRPDICRVAIPENGVYDMLRYQHFTIGNAWRSEYGSSDNKTQYRCLKKYSPLHNVRDTAYPAMIVITGDHDDRVVPMHAYKYVTTLQKRTTGSRPIVLYQRHNTGHQGNDIYTDNYVYSFIYDQMGISPTKIRWSYY